MNYTLDTNAAKAADVLFSKIDQKGPYMGVLTRAEPITSKKGAQGVDLSFKADSGATADYLTLWTHNVDNKQLSGFNVLMAIMTCLKLRELKTEFGDIEKYDSLSKQRSIVNVPLYKGLMNKPVGLLIHLEEYEKTAGGTAWKPMISAPFDASGFTASEILSKAMAPATMNKMVLALRDRPLKQSSKPMDGYKPAFSENPGAGMSEADIPF